MRLFIAVNMDDILRSRITNIIDKLRTQTVRGNFTRPENLHITLTFLGEIVPERIGDITDIMRNAGKENNRKLSLELSDVGRFNDTWWIGVKKNQPLWELQRTLSELLRHRGFNIEKRAFRPHLTICRKPVFTADFNEAAFRSDTNPMVKELVWEADRFDLMLSERIDGRMKYSVLHSTGLS